MHKIAFSYQVPPSTQGSLQHSQTPQLDFRGPLRGTERQGMEDREGQKDEERGWITPPLPPIPGSAINLKCIITLHCVSKKSIPAIILTVVV